MVATLTSICRGEESVPIQGICTRYRGCPAREDYRSIAKPAEYFCGETRAMGTLPGKHWAVSCRATGVRSPYLRFCLGGRLPLEFVHLTQFDSASESESESETGAEDEDEFVAVSESESESGSGSEAGADSESKDSESKSESKSGLRHGVDVMQPVSYSLCSLAFMFILYHLFLLLNSPRLQLVLYKLIRPSLSLLHLSYVVPCYI
jgi:hypothetical protein